MTPPDKQSVSPLPRAYSVDARRRGDALAAALAKVNHDLRNALATATLAAPRIAASSDPLLKRVLQRMTEGMEHAVELCSEALTFAAGADMSAAPPTHFALHTLAAEVGQMLAEDFEGVGWTNTIDPAIELSADRDGMSVLFTELGRNAFENGANQVRIGSRVTPQRVFIDIADDGPGLKPRARAKLFTPFLGTTRPGRTGFGLVLARTIARAQGGGLRLESSSEAGTVFTIDLPQPSNEPG